MSLLFSGQDRQPLRGNLDRNSYKACRCSCPIRQWVAAPDWCGVAGSRPAEETGDFKQ